MKRIAQRWSTEPWKTRQAEVIRTLTQGGDIHSLGLPDYEGFLDLRGITFPRPKHGREVGTVMTGFGTLHKPVPGSGRLTISTIEISDVDLSEADLRETSWVGCRFHNVVLRDAVVGQAFFPSCSFEQVIFDGADLVGTPLAGVAGQNPNVYRNVSFVFADLRKTGYTYPLFEGCDFSNAVLDNVDFNGSRFVECKFGGRLDGVWFHGWYWSPDLADQKRFSAEGLDPRTIRNPMRHVDFSTAYLDDCMFVDEIDLSSCKFPKDSSHIIISDRRRVFANVENAIQTLWPEPARSEAVDFVRQLRDRPNKQMQQMDVFNRDTFERNPHVRLQRVPSWYPRFFDLLAWTADRFA